MHSQHKLLIISFFLLIVLVVNSFAVKAQTDTFTFSNSGVTFTYSSEWTHLENTDGSVTLALGDNSLTLFDLVSLSNILTLTQTTLDEDVVRGLLDASADRLTPSGAVQEVDIDGRGFMMGEYSADPDRRGRILAIAFGDQSFGAVDFSAPAAAFEDGWTLAREVVVSFDLILGDPCTVRTGSGDVTLRVGPGTNRSAIVFLPVNRDFAVLGQARANDGSIWWKLDKEIVAPQTGANELWVAQADVASSGDCDRVPEAPIPVIIPIIPSVGEEGEGAGETVTIVLPTGALGSLIGAADATLCTGDSSAAVVSQSWGANVDKAASCVYNLLTWGSQAAAQQGQRQASGQCRAAPTAAQLNEYYQAYWALADVGAGYFNLGLALKRAGNTSLMNAVGTLILRDFSCSWVWDPAVGSGRLLLA